MTDKYSEQMDILVSNFNKELKDILNNRGIDELGIRDLEKLNEDFKALDKLNKELVSEARSNLEIDNFALGELLEKGKHLYDDNRVSLVEIDKALATKKALVHEKMAQRRELNNQKRSNLRTLESLRSAARHSKDNQVSADINHAIERAESLDKEYDQAIENINKVIDQLLHGGKIETIEIVREENQTVDLPEQQQEQPVQQQEPPRRPEEEYVDTRTPEEKEQANLIQHYYDTYHDEFMRYVNEGNAHTVDEIVAHMKEFERAQSAPSQDGPTETVDIPTFTSEPPEVQTQPEPEPDQPEPGQPEPDQPEPVQPEPDQPAPAQTGPSYPAGSLADLRDKGTLPKNLSDEDLIRISNVLGMRATDMDFVPNKEQLARLTGDKEIKLAFTNERISSMHRSEAERFSRVSENYDRIDTTGLGSNFEDRVRTESNNVDRGLSTVQAQGHRIAADSVTEHLDIDPHALDGITRMRLEGLNDRSDELNEKIREQYEVLDSQREVQAHTKIKQMFKDFRIGRTQRRIESLQKKEARVSGKQFKIMDEKAKQYIERKNKELAAFQEKQRKTEQKIAEVRGLMSERDRAQEELAAHDIDIQNTQGRSLGDRIERFQLERSRAKVQRDFDRLSRKIAACDRRAQVKESIFDLTMGSGAMTLSA